MNTKTITDIDVERHIKMLQKMAGSNDLKAMIRADLRYCDSAYAWHKRTREMFRRLGIWYVTAAAGVAGGLGLHYWMAMSYGPMAAGCAAVVGLPLFICGFLWLCNH